MQNSKESVRLPEKAQGIIGEENRRHYLVNRKNIITVLYVRNLNGSIWF